MPDSPRLKTRDRKSTEDQIIAAFEVVLLRDGVSGLGINSVAAEAGINKVLIYRYFGDMAGLARRWVGSHSFWPDERELIGGSADAIAALPVEERIRLIMRNFVELIRTRPRTIELLSAELLSPTDVTRALAEGLAKPGSSLSNYTRLESADRDLTEHVWQLTQIVYATVAYLAIRSRNNPVYFGLDLTTDEGWQDIIVTVDQMVERFLRG